MRGSGVSIGTKLFDYDGHVELLGLNDPAEISLSRRVTATPTLDGGSFVSDSGYAPSDRVFNYSMTGNDKTYIDNIIRIAKLHSRLVLCINEGAFEVIIKAIFYVNGTVRISFITVGNA